MSSGNKRFFAGHRSSWETSLSPIEAGKGETGEARGVVLTTLQLIQKKKHINLSPVI